MPLRQLMSQHLVWPVSVLLYTLSYRGCFTCSWICTASSKLVTLLLQQHQALTQRNKKHYHNLQLWFLTRVLEFARLQITHMVHDQKHLWLICDFHCHLHEVQQRSGLVAHLSVARPFLMTWPTSYHQVAPALLAVVSGLFISDNIHLLTTGELLRSISEKRRALVYTKPVISQ